jgi:glycosyltransferase involved in cell wall biosynthesis
VTQGRVSLVATVLDEVATVDELLNSIARQTRPPDEVVIVDGGSRDGTWERLLAWGGRLPLRPLRAEGANIARGRNLAIGAAGGELIAVTDAGVRLDPCWLEKLLGRVRPGVDVVAGFFRPDAHTAFEVAMGATVLPDRAEIKPDSFLPSSRSVLFRRSAWETAGGYPEWLDYCEDLVFDLALKRAGCRFVFAPEAVAWFRPRGSLRAFFRQYFLYARGDGKADLWRTRHGIRYATYLGAPILLLAGPQAWSWLLLLAGAALYLRRPYARLARELDRPEPAAACTVVLVPIIRAVGDVAKMLGYPVGVAWRLRHAPK